jgi:hypothetical protein
VVLPLNKIQATNKNHRKMKTTKLIYPFALLAALMLLGVFSSCKKVPPPPPAGSPAKTSIVINGGHLVTISHGTKTTITASTGVSYSTTGSVITFNSYPQGVIDIVIGPEVGSLTGNDSTVVRSKSVLSLSDFTFLANDSSAFFISVNANNLTAKANNHAHLSLTGSAGTFNVTVSDSSDFMGCDFVAANCNATVKKSSYCGVNATSTLTTDVELNSVLMYNGTPVIKNNNIGLVLKGCIGVKI